MLRPALPRRPRGNIESIRQTPESTTAWGPAIPRQIRQRGHVIENRAARSAWPPEHRAAELNPVVQQGGAGRGVVFSDGVSAAMVRCAGRGR